MVRFRFNKTVAGGTAQSPVPLVRQAEAGECGLACVAMMAQFHGREVDLPDLRERFSLTRTGLNLLDLQRIADALSLRCRALRLELSELPGLRLPAILHWDLDHFVVASRLCGKSLIVNDPAKGTRRYSLDELGLHFTGVALEVNGSLPAATPSVDEASCRSKDVKPDSTGFSATDKRVAGDRLGLRSLAAFVDSWRVSATHIGILSLLIQFLAILSPLYLQLVIDQGINGSDSQFVLLLGLLFLLVCVGKTALGYFRDRQLLKLSSYFSSNLARECFDHLIRLPMRYFSSRELGDIVSRFQASEKISRFITYELVAIMVDGFFSSLTLVLLFAYNAMLASVGLFAVVVIVALRLMAIPLEQPLREQQITAAARQETSFLETVKGVHSVKSCGAEEQFANRWFSRYANSLNAGFRLAGFQLRLGSLQSLIQSFEQLLTVYLGALLIIDGRLSLGQFMSFYFLRQHFCSSVLAMLPKLAELRMLRIELARLQDIVGQPRPSELPHEGLLSQKLAGPLTANRLGFSYGLAAGELINDLSFTVESGQCLGIVGASGCGKSTLLRLLTGLEKADRGEITVAGHPLEQVSKQQLRLSMASVLHEDQLFTGTLAFNIHLGRRRADARELNVLLELVELDVLVTSLPLGLRTPLGDLGSLLSAGQTQRLLLARALFNTPTILILDEAFSHVDDDTALRILGRLKDRQQTLVLVSHNPLLLKEMDDVLTMN